MSIKRDFNSIQTVDDLTIRLGMMPLTNANYYISDKIDAALILERLNESYETRRDRTMLEAYAAAMYGVQFDRVISG